MPTTYRSHHASAISDPFHLNPWPLLQQTTGELPVKKELRPLFTSTELFGTVHPQQINVGAALWRLSNDVPVGTYLELVRPDVSHRRKKRNDVTGNVIDGSNITSLCAIAHETGPGQIVFGRLASDTAHLLVWNLSLDHDMESPCRFVFQRTHPTTSQCNRFTVPRAHDL